MSYNHTLVAGVNSAILTVSGASRVDLYGLKVWASPTSGFTPEPSNLKYSGPGFSYTLENLPGNIPLYVKYAVISTLGSLDTDDYTISAELAVTPYASTSDVVEYFDNYSTTYNPASNVWSTHTGSATLQLQESGGYTGSQFLKVTKSDANPVYLVMNNLIPFNPDKLYRIKLIAQKTSGISAVLAGVAGVSSDGSTLVNYVGAPVIINQHNIVDTTGITTTWNTTSFVGYIKGTSVIGTTTASPDVTTPGKLHTNVKYIKLLVAVGGSAGEVLDIDSILLEEIPSNVGAVDQITSANSSTLIGDTAIASAQISSLTADKILAGTIQADTSITVGTTTDGLVISNNNANTAGDNKPTIKVFQSSSERVRLGYVDSTYGYGIQGKIGTTTNFRLTDSGLYLRPTLESLSFFAGAPGWTTIASGVLSQTPVGPDLYTITNYKLVHALGTPSLLGIAMLYIKILSSFDRWNMVSGASSYAICYKDFTFGFRLTESGGFDAWSTTGLGVQTVFQDSSDTTYFSNTKFTAIMDLTGATVPVGEYEGPGIYLSITTRSSMAGDENVTYLDDQQTHYVVKKFTLEDPNWTFG